MKHVLSAAALAASLAAPAAASAATIANLGVDPTSASGAFNRSLGSLVGRFDDQFTFSLDQNMTLTIASITNVFPARKDFISGFVGGVFAGNPNHPGAEVIGPVPATLGCGAIKQCQSLAGSAILAAGTYFLDVKGFAHGSSGYGGNLATTALAATPLPAALPMFVGGLGVLSWFGWRRKQS